SDESGYCCFFFSSRRRHTRSKRDWSSDVCSSDLKHVSDLGSASPAPAQTKVPEPKPAPEPVKLNPNQTHVFLAPKAEPPKIKTLEAKPVELNPVFEQVKIEGPKNQPKRPKDEVKVGNLGSGSAAVPTVVAPLNKVQ